jgi:hypothetical protein
MPTSLPESGGAVQLRHKSIEMETVQVAAVQLSPVLYSREGTVARDLDAKIEMLLETAAR